MPDDKPAPRKRSFVKRAFAALFLLAFTGIGIVAIASLAVYVHVTRPGTPGEKVRVTIPEGASGREIARILEEQGLVETRYFFRLAVRVDKTRRPIKSGTYDLPKGASALQLLQLIQQGPNAMPQEIPAELRPAIPEGLTIQQASKLFPDPKAYVDAASDPKLIAKLGIKAKTLEGFLMPNTYFFGKKPAEREVVERMIEQFQKTYAQLAAENPPPQRYDTMAVITIASLVEEEAKVPEERPMIAAVIYNRLKQDMPLQIDSTLQYSLDKYGQRLLDEDKKADSPYNTYKNKGLPPGPISSPGASSIKAALRPAQTDALYFVATGDGRTHTFSKTLDQQNKAVRQYRKEIAPQRKKTGK